MSAFPVLLLTFQGRRALSLGLGSMGTVWQEENSQGWAKARGGVSHEQPAWRGPEPQEGTAAGSALPSGC